MDQIAIPQPTGGVRKRPERLAGDKGYDFPRIRKWLATHHIASVIPRRDDPRIHRRGRPKEFDREAYRRRSIIEQCIGWLKECRRIGTRFEKLALNFLAMIKVAMIHRYLKYSFSDTA